MTGLVTSLKAADDFLSVPKTGARDWASDLRYGDPIIERINGAVTADSRSPRPNRHSRKRMTPDTCPLCGATVTVLGANTAGWVVLCTFGHQAVVDDRDMTWAPSGHAPPETGREAMTWGVIVVDYDRPEDYDTVYDTKKVLAPLWKARRQLDHMVRMTGMTDAGVPRYRLTEDQLDRIDDLLAEVRTSFANLETANRREAG